MTRRNGRRVRQLLAGIVSALLLTATQARASTAGERCRPCRLVVRANPGSGALAAVPQEAAPPRDAGWVDVVSAVYWKEYEETGWDRLEVEVLRGSPVPESVMARAVGYAEGQFTAERIYHFWTNYRKNEFHTSDHQPTPALLDWLSTQQAHVRGQAAQLGATSDYWRRMGLVLAQFDGLAEGLWGAAQPGQNLSAAELYVLQSVGDMYDLAVLFPQRDNATVAANGREAAWREYTPGHGEVGPEGYAGGEWLECSAMIKLQPAAAAAGSRRQMRQGAAPPPADFWAGHATWRPFYNMVRVWKAYDVPWAASGPVTAPSCPGLSGYSKDDWYTTDRFLILETTNGVYNKSLYDVLQPECALMWQRVQVANMGARSGQEWTSLFAEQNSGTYNNQWMVLDVHALMAGERTGVLWVLEQLPGTVEVADLSDVLLGQGFWPSFNVPYFPRIYRLAGYPADKDIHGTCPRAKLFAREQSKIANLRDFMSLMRLNRYQSDPLSLGSPANAIAARYDLEPVPGSAAAGAGNWTCKPTGAVDAKVVDLHAFLDAATYAVNGPTAEDQLAFSWSSFCGQQAPEGKEPGGVKGPRAAGAVGSPHQCDISREGLVDVFEFDWQYLQASSGSMAHRRHSERHAGLLELWREA
eukprot:jgi/Tetstr1/445971/TSEL_000300.t1